MTRARRIHQGERTHSERVLDDDDFDADGTYAGAEKVGEPRTMPERMCKSCTRLAEPDTAYGVIIAPSGLGHYWPEQDRTLCGVDTTSWPNPT
jgi:hypothetical protein